MQWRCVAKVSVAGGDDVGGGAGAGPGAVGRGGSARRERLVSFASDVDGAPREREPRRSGPPRWPAATVKAAHANRAHARGEAEAWHEGRGEERMTEAAYIASMLGERLVGLLNEAGLLSEPATVADLLDEQLSIEDVECYIGPSTGAGVGDAEWARYRRALMSFGVPRECEL